METKTTPFKTLNSAKVSLVTQIADLSLKVKTTNLSVLDHASAMVKINDCQVDRITKEELVAIVAQNALDDLNRLLETYAQIDDCVLESSLTPQDWATYNIESPSGFHPDTRVVIKTKK